MGLFSSRNSWSSQAKGYNGFFHPKTCPPVDDCDLKKFVGSRRPPAGLTPRQEKELAKLKKQAEAKKQRSWPNAGKYTPKK